MKYNWIPFESVEEEDNKFFHYFKLTWFRGSFTRRNLFWNLRWCEWIRKLDFQWEIVQQNHNFPFGNAVNFKFAYRDWYYVVTHAFVISDISLMVSKISSSRRKLNQQRKYNILVRSLLFVMLKVGLILYVRVSNIKTCCSSYATTQTFTSRCCSISPMHIVCTTWL